MRTAQLVTGRGVGVVRGPGIVDGDPGERGKDTHRFHRLGAALGVHHEQGVLAGAGALHPVQPTVRAEPALIEPGHLAGSDVVPHPRQEAIEPSGRALPAGLGRA